MIEYKQGANARVPVVVESVFGFTGVTYNRVTATIKKADGTMVDASPASASYWVEATTGAFAGQGEYDLIIPSAMLNQLGVLVYIVKVDGAYAYRGVIKVISADAADVKTVADDIKTLATLIKKLKTNKAVVDSATAVLTVYDDNGTTPILTLNLKDAAGAASATSVYQRVP